MVRRIILVDIGSGLKVTGVLPSVALFSEYSAKLTATGGLPPYTFEVVAGALPDGIEMDSGTGMFSGTAEVAGIFSFTVRVTDIGGTYVERLCQIAVIAEPLMLSGSAPDGAVGSAQSFTYVAAGGVPPYSFELIDAPPGWSVPDSSAPTISYTPESAGLLNWTLRVTDSNGDTFDLDDSATFEIVVVVQTLLSSVLAAADIVLDGAKTTATSTATHTGGTVLSASGKTAGKFYVEARYLTTADWATVIMGLHLGTSSLSSYLGADTAGWGTLVTGTTGGGRETRHNGVTANAISIAFALPQTARMAVDISAGKLWLAPFGSSVWAGGGDPAAGTSPTYTFDPEAGTYYLALCPRSAGNQVKLIDPASWAFAAPTGFGVWE